MMESIVDNEANAGFGAQAGRFALIALGSVGALLGAGVVTGFIVAHQQQGGAMTARQLLILAGALLFVLGCGFTAWRGIRAALAASAGDGPPTPREGRYRAVMLIAALTGAVISVILMLQNDALTDNPIGFLSGPVSPAIAIVLALLVGVLIPALSIYWHLRAIDEQEAAAYNKGALFAAYAYWIGAPVWWLLWRGGLVAAPHGVAIYLVTIAIASVTWFWAKYR